jgi:hypothetical protein
MGERDHDPAVDHLCPGRRLTIVERQDMVLTLKVLAAGAVAGIAANVTGYLITGWLFHRYQSRTPGTWRPVESSMHYQYAVALRIVASIGIALLCSVVWSALAPGNHGLSTGLGFGLILWGATILPLVLEASLFVNWHRGFVIGLLLDWLVVCVLASGSAAVTLLLSERR